VLNEASTTMQARLWWAAGWADGPISVIELTSPVSGATTNLPVVNVPIEFDLPTGTRVEVHGDPFAGAAAIRVRGVTLWSSARSFTLDASAT